METVSARPKRQFKLPKFVLSWYGILAAYLIIIGLFLLIRAIDGDTGNNPIALKLGSLTFRWYGVIITCGVILASFLAQFLAERRKDDPEHVWRILPILLVTAIVAARIWYVVFTWDSYKNYVFSVGDPVHAGAIEIWRGGIAIQGAVVGGLLGAALYGYFYNQRLKAGRTKYKTRFSLPRFADYVAPGLVLAQGIGRWGNFMNNEAYGRETHMPWGIHIPCDYRTTGVTPGTADTTCPGALLPTGQIRPGGIAKDALFHPTFLYESLWDYFTFLILFFCIMKPKTVERRFKIKLRDGDIFLLYLVIYSIGRFFTESLRTDSLYVIGTDPYGLRSAQVTALVEILIGGFLLFFRHRSAFPDLQKLSIRLPLPVATAAGPSLATAPVTESSLPTSTVTDDESDDLDSTAVVAENSDETEATERDKPDYKARVRPPTATAETEDMEEASDEDEIAVVGVEPTEVTPASETVVPTLEVPDMSVLATKSEIKKEDDLQS